MPMIEDTIKRAILAGSKSRYRLAKETGISEAQLSRVMSGERGLGLASAEKLADALGLKITIRPTGRRQSKGVKR
jgi:transcriptional regulator with XRE-family HTH domain